MTSAGSPTDRPPMAWPSKSHFQQIIFKSYLKNFLFNNFNLFPQLIK
jgi:hypothetical protein